jgi:hypothetical protein
VPATSSSQRPSLTRPLAGCHLAAPPQTTTLLYRSGLPTNMRGTMPSADFCGALRKDCSPLSPMQGHPADLPRSAVIPSVHRRRIDQVRPVVDGGLRGGVPTRPERTTPHIRFVFVAPRVWIGLPPDPTSRWTLLPFSSPSAPRTPGTRTFTSLVLCHAWHTRESSPALSSVRCSAWSACGVCALTSYL